MRKQRWCGALLALALVLTLLPTAAWATNGTHEHYLCGGDTCTGVGHTESDKTAFTTAIKQENGKLYVGDNEWAVDTSLISEGVYVLDNGTYYLVSDITLDNQLRITGNEVTLCLNGYHISKSDTTRVISVGGKFTLTDCKNTGTIGEAVGVDAEAVFDLYGGTITGSKSTGVYADGDFHMYGGAITGNTSSDYGGVYVGGIFTMYGGSITGNYKGTGENKAASNVYLPEGKTITVGGALTSSSKIGVTTAAVPAAHIPVTIAAGADGYTLTDTDASAFTSDGDYVVGQNANGITLAPAHTHSWGYTGSWDGSTVTRTCKGTSENGGVDFNGGSVTISAPANLTYDGTQKAAVLTNTMTGEPDPTITYQVKAGDDDWTDLPAGTIPVEPGTYRAKTSFVGYRVSVSVVYTIKTHDHIAKAGSICTDGIKCAVCDYEMYPVQTAHSFGGWTQDANASTHTGHCQNTGCTKSKTGSCADSDNDGKCDACGRALRSSTPYYPPSYAASVSETEHGSVSVSPKTAAAGTTVTVTVTPDQGYTLETLTVTDAGGKELPLTDKGDGKYTFTQPASKVTVKATFMDDNTMLNFFADVNASDYFYDAVLWAAQKGITSGISATAFGPNQPCTRAQIVTFLWRAAGSPVVNYAMSMDDVNEGSYYAEAVRWALSLGVTTGTGADAFSPDASCTRAQAVTFLARALNAKASGKAAFSDVPSGSYYADAVAWAAESGVTTGTSADAFSPDDVCTRAQIVTFLYRAFQ